MIPGRGPEGSSTRCSGETATGPGLIAGAGRGAAGNPAGAGRGLSHDPVTVADSRERDHDGNAHSEPFTR